MGNKTHWSFETRISLAYCGECTLRFHNFWVSTVLSTRSHQNFEIFLFFNSLHKVHNVIKEFISLLRTEINKENCKKLVASHTQNSTDSKVMSFWRTSLQYASEILGQWPVSLFLQKIIIIKIKGITWAVFSWLI